MAAVELTESESEQARAQQHEAGRCQRQETTGDIITITHGTPAIRDAGPNCLNAGPNYLKISESAFERGTGPSRGIRPSTESLQMHGQ